MDDPSPVNPIEWYVCLVKKCEVAINIHPLSSTILDFLTYIYLVNGKLTKMKESS